MKQRSGQYRLTVVVVSVAFLLLVVSFGCDSTAANSGPTGPDNLVTVDPDLPQKLVQKVIDSWCGVEYATNPDATTTSNDAVNFVESLKALGYSIPAATLKGLYYNYHTEAGYDIMSEYFYEQHDFVFTQPSSVGEADLKAGEWSLLEYADLIFVDYNTDGYWNNAMIYIGPYDDIEHAVIRACDYHLETLIVDIEHYVIVFDIEYGNSDVRRPAFENFANYYD